MNQPETKTDMPSGEGTADGPELLRNFCSHGFDSDIEAASISLGRDPDELRSMLDGEAPVDDDLVMKVRGIAQERGISL